MNDKKKKSKFINKLTNKYRLIFLNDSTFQELGYIRLSRLNIITVTGTLFIFLVALTYIAIAYTPVRELIPGYPDAEMRHNIINNRIQLDSLELELKFRDQYFENLSLIISGKEPNNFLNISNDTLKKEYKNIQFSKPSADSTLRKEIELIPKPEVQAEEPVQTNTSLEKVHFFPPARGIITNSFNPLNNHFGTDIVAAPNEVVKATLDGTVIMASWTLQTGYVMQIQHKNNIISFYKHNAELLKKVGARVKAGDAIAIIGNSGELTTGPHLHFELWYNGMAINPEDYIIF